MTGPTFSAQALAERLQALPVAPRAIVVAFSGGADSTALLVAAAALVRSGQLTAVRAVHVHHGLQDAADGWAAHAVAAGARIGVAVSVARVDAVARRGESPEAAARRARYDALARAASGHETVCTGHHLDDQAETVLLALLRGGTPGGLAAMPALRRLGGGWLARPLLGFSHAALTAFLTARGEPWVEDPSNSDTALDRAALRTGAMPALRARWPGVARRLGRAAGRQAQTLGLLRELAELDLNRAASERDEVLSCRVLRELGPARVRNLILAWLARSGLPALTEGRLNAVWPQVLEAAADACPVLRWPGGELRRYRDGLYLLRPAPAHDPARRVRFLVPGPVDLGHGLLTMERSSAGMRLGAAAARPAEVRFRQGGERCRPAGRAGSRALQRLMQEAGIPPWERARLPLLFLDDELAAAPGLFVADRLAARDGEPGWRLRWLARDGGHRSEGR